jgi:organic hydroperoxide reductase OsmC/OhrA
MAAIHTYQASLTWSGSTGRGYRDYDRAHRVVTTPARTELEVSADRSFRGDANLVNPEQLLLAAATSCQLLSFLALAARAGIDVQRYADDAEAEMPVTRGPMRITRIVLRPRIVVAAGADLTQVAELVVAAHHECYVANTLNCTVDLEPVIDHAP